KGVVKGVIHDDPVNDPSELTLSIAGIQARPSRDGTFIINDVPYGTHELTVTAKDEILHSTRITIITRELEIEIALIGEVPLTNPSFEERPEQTTPPGWRSGFNW